MANKKSEDNEETSEKVKVKTYGDPIVEIASGN